VAGGGHGGTLWSSFCLLLGLHAQSQPERGQTVHDWQKAGRRVAMTGTPRTSIPVDVDLLPDVQWLLLLWLDDIETIGYAYRWYNNLSLNLFPAPASTTSEVFTPFLSGRR